MENDKLNVALVCIAKDEDLYLEEWINYHLSLGFKHIYIYDNNDTKTDKLIEIGENPNVTVLDVNGRQNLIKRKFQPGLYKEAYYNFGKSYDWMAFFDVDEFLVINNNKTLNEFLFNFSDIDVIHINWRYFGDNDLVYYDSRPVMERFKNPAPENVKYAKKFPENNHVKSIIKTKLPFTNFGCHTCWFTNAKCKHSSGEISDVKSDFHNYNFIVAQINHYGTKTIDEYIKRRCLSTKVASNNKDISIENRIKWFFNVNKHTKEKDIIVNFVQSKLNK